MSFAIGSLVRARGREWVVLPETREDLVMVRPLGGTDDEVTGIYLPLESVEPATFALPDPALLGDHRSCRLLREAVRLSSRASAGPFRSFGRIAVEPRPYQLVPLLLALRQDPVRLLIADDVGIGKTIEAALIARELLDRGEVQRLAVLCPPHLAEQWQRELRQKFHIDAELVLPATAARLERQCRLGQSLFEKHPYVIVSTDFIKSDRRRDEFVRTCPELVIVDEAHTCAFGEHARSGRHQRHETLKRLSADPGRHLILVTATPHSGKEEAFRSLLSFLAPDLANLPSDLTGRENEPHRRRLAAHLVQRRRPDIEHYLGADTEFPKREEMKEATYRLSREYAAFFDRVVHYAREQVRDPSGAKHRRRVRWWSALALLRSIASSPAAAEATLTTRAETDNEDEREIEESRRQELFDEKTEEQSEGVDLPPAGDAEEGDDPETANRRRLRAFAKEAAKLRGDKDNKLVDAARHIRAILNDGFRPIVFCRYIATAEYVADELRRRLPKGVAIDAVTGQLPPEDREARVLELATHEKRVLVCTDCLSEGINLQDHFDAVVHYDLAWSPTRHEQREGRVDRFGQPSKTVRVLTYWGADNRVDGIVLDILLNKHKAIRKALGVAVPVPVSSGAVVEAVLEGLLLREEAASGTGVLPGFEDYFRPRREALHAEWQEAADREKRSRTLFAQESIRAEHVQRELDEARASVGSAADVRRFVLEAVRAHDGSANERNDRVDLGLKTLPRALRDVLPAGDDLHARFELPVGEKKGETYLSRTHPLVEGLASYVLDTALDPLAKGVARRAGAIRTRAVQKRTTLLLVRFRYDVVTRREGFEPAPQLAEETRLLAFEGAPAAAVWLDDAAAEALQRSEPEANINPEQARDHVAAVIDGFAALAPKLDEEAQRRASALVEAHRRVRSAARLRGVSYRVEPQLPPDVLGIYVFLPAGSPGGSR